VCSNSPRFDALLNGKVDMKRRTRINVQGAMIGLLIVKAGNPVSKAYDQD